MSHGMWSRRPLSVVVLGNSMPLMQIPARQCHDQGNYPEVLADRLVAAGIPVDLHNESRWFEFADSAARRYTNEIIQLAPDVLIVHFGVNEMMPWLLPVPLLRHLMRQNQSLSRVAKRYRRQVAEPVWSSVKKYRTWSAARVGLATWQLSPRKFRASMELILDRAGATSKPLVLVVDINPPGELLCRYLPGLEERYEIYDRLLADIVRDTASPDVRLVEASSIARRRGVRAALRDGLHWNAEGHAEVGEMLTAEILDWLGSPNPHASPTDRE